MDELTYPINLMDFGAKSSGDVLTRDGEYLGVWHTDDRCEQGWIKFTPDGADQPLFQDLMMGVLCARIGQWARENESL